MCIDNPKPETARHGSVRAGLLWTALLAGLSSSPVHALEGAWSWALDVGKSTSKASIGRPSFDLYRLGLQREYCEPLLSGERMSLSGYFEASLNYWNAGVTDIYALAFSPVFALYLAERDGSFRAYLEAGLGGALLSDTDIAGRDLSTTFQFEIRFGAGLRSERFDFHLRYMHYSNGSIKQPNHGVDAVIAGLAITF